MSSKATSEDNNDDVVPPSKSGVKRRIADEDSHDSKGGNKQKKPRIENDEENSEEGNGDAKSSSAETDKDKAKAEKKAKVEKWLKTTVLSNKPRITQKENKNLQKAIQFMEFDESKSTISKWTRSKKFNSWMCSHTYAGMRSFSAKFEGIVDKQPTPTRENGVAVRLSIRDPAEREKIRKIDAHCKQQMHTSAKAHEKADEKAILANMLQKNSDFVPMLERGQPRDFARREEFQGSDIPEDVECFPDTFKITVDYAKEGPRTQLSRCYDISGKPMQALQLKKGNRVVVQFKLGYGTIYKTQGGPRKYGLTPHLEELYVLDDTEISDGKEEAASMDDDEIAALRQKYSKKAYLPESSGVSAAKTDAKQPELPAFVAAAKSDAKDVVGMTAPPPLESVPVAVNAASEVKTESVATVPAPAPSSQNTTTEINAAKETVKETTKPLTKQQQMMQKKQDAKK